MDSARRSAAEDGGEAPPSRGALLAAWALPVAASLMMVFVGIQSFSHAPAGPQWDAELTANATYNPYKEKTVYEERGRRVYRYYRVSVWSLALASDAWVFKTKAQGLPASACQGVLPRAQVVFNLYRVLIASVEIWALFSPTCSNAFVNPGLGMYGWASTFAVGFPREGFTDAVHVLLGVAASVSLTMMLRVASSPAGFAGRALWQRLCLAGCLGLVFWYPIYDAKHWYIGSHLANLGGEYLPVFALFSALFECVRSQEEKDDDASGEHHWQFGELLDWFQAAMLALAMFKFCWDLAYTSDSLDAPMHYPDVTPPPQFSLMIGQTNLSKHWKEALVYGLNLGGMILLFIIAELCRAREGGDGEADSALEDSDHATDAE